MLSSFFKRLLMGRQLEFAEGDIEILETKFTMHSLSHYFYWREFEKQKRIERIGESEDYQPKGRGKSVDSAGIFFCETLFQQKTKKPGKRRRILDWNADRRFRGNVRQRTGRRRN